MAARVLPLSEIKEENESFGRKVNSLIQLINHGFEVIDSFVITENAFSDFIKKNNLENKIKHLLSNNLEHAVQKQLNESKLPPDLIKEILKEYKKFGTVLEDSEVNIYLSDSPTENIKGETSLIEKIKQLWSGRLEEGDSLADKRGGNSILVQKVHFGKHGKVRTSSKFINSIHPFSENEITTLENMISKFKNHFYLPHEIEFVLEKSKVLISRIRPETHVAVEDLDTRNNHYKITGNSHY